MSKIHRKYYGSVALILLLSLAVYLLYNRKNSTLSRRSGDFIPENIAAIDRIVISQSGESVTLEQADGYWTANSGIPVRHDRMRLLFDFMNRLEIVSPVSKSIRDEILEHFTSDSKSVRLFVRGRMNKHFKILWEIQ